jgi:AraC-like DNA-binding protein
VDAGHPGALSLADAARLAGRKSGHFSRDFKRTVGVRFREWNAHRRVRLAVERPFRPGETIERIAEFCGFGSSRTFQRHCARCAGVTPSQLRRAVREAGPEAGTAEEGGRVALGVAKRS